MISSIPEFGQRVQGQMYVPRPGAYALILDAEARLAVMETPRGCFLPGGGSEGGETPEQTLIREVQEECGFDVNVARRIGEAMEYVFTAGNAEGIRKECVFFQAMVHGSGGVATEADHVLVWLDPREAQVRMAHESQRWAVGQMLETAANLPMFDHLPDLPQMVTLKRVVFTLWKQDDVVALWLGGSFAREEADKYSDIDLRVAVRPEAEEQWRKPDLGLLFGGEVAGCTPFPLDGGMLHHLALTSGDIYDLWIQTTEEAPSQDAVLVLGCRDEAFSLKLMETKPSPVPEPVPADPAAVRQMVASFWINSLKHRKVLHRGLDLVAQTGVGMERTLLQRLWFIAATGRDGVSPRPTIHTLTELDRVVMAAQGMHGLSLTGGPLTCRDEIMRAIEVNRDEVAVVGRCLAADLGFEYPEALEETVRETWRQYRDGAAREEA